VYDALARLALYPLQATEYLGVAQAPNMVPY